VWWLQVWWLPGGAGNPTSAAGFDDIAASIVAQLPAVVMYLPDKRGTGQSSFFSCSPPSLFLTDLGACFAQLRASDDAQDRLATTSYTNTARDMLFLINATRMAVSPSQQVVVVGNSNGGFLAQRMMALLPTTSTSAGRPLIDAVILNSAPPANGFNISEGFVTADSVALGVVAACQADAACAARFLALSSSPVADAGVYPCVHSRRER
jgi:pimeloyl-ACP methyl ester carboxylesterase